MILSVDTLILHSKDSTDFSRKLDKRKVARHKNNPQKPAAFPHAKNLLRKKSGETPFTIIPT